MADGFAFQEEVKHDEDANYNIEEDCQVQEVDVRLLFGPLKKRGCETGFHYGRESNVDDL